MTKWELVSLTLDQLISQWKRVPESRDQFDVSYINSISGYYSVTIKWDPKPSKKEAEQPQTHIPKAISVSFQQHGIWSGACSCSITDTTLLPQPKATKEITSEHRSLAVFSRMHKNIRYLHEEILRYKRTKENNSFLEDLMKVFPRTLDGAILGDEYDE